MVHLLQQKMKLDQVVVSLLIWETCGDTVAQKSPDWNSDVESWTESEGTSSSGQCEHNMEILALNVVEQDQSGEKISLFLGTCEGGFELPHCPGHVVPGNARVLVAGLPLPRRPAAKARKVFLSPWAGCDKGERCGDRNEGEGT